MKRILFLIPALNAGGAERVMVTLANEWVKENEVTIMVFNDGDCFYEINRNVTIKPMRRMPAKDGIKRYCEIPIIEIQRFKNIYEEILCGDYDLILSFCYTTNLMVSLVSAISNKKNIVISERNDIYQYSKWLRKLINYFYKRNVAIICQNDVVRQYFIEKKFKCELPILPNPVNFNDIPRNQRLRFNKEIVTVGRLIPQKNQMMLIEAFNEIKDDFPDYVLKIYGKGPLEQELKEIIIKLGLENRVFLMGVKKKVMYELQQSAFFVLPSSYEGFPNVLIEAMGTGLPVISSDFRTGIARELILSSDNGYVFETNNKDSLVEVLKKMLNRERDFFDIGNNNRGMAEGYKDNVIADRWLNTITEIINKARNY